MNANGKHVSRIAVISRIPGLVAGLKTSLGDQYEVYAAPTGMAGIAMLEHMQPDMLMIGTTLHDMSGAYLLGHLQDEHDWVSKIPVVCAISPDAVEDDINSIQGIAPKCEFIKTTWPPDHIAAKVRELLEAAAVSKTH